MKKHRVLFLAVFMMLLSACPNPIGDGGNNNDDDGKPSPDKKTQVYFVNGNDFPIAVYSDSSRLVKFADVGANAESNPVETDPNDVTFYVSYRLLIDNQEFPYNRDLLARIDAEKITRITIPLLSELDADDLAEPVTNDVYIKIQNAGASALVLRRGAYEEIPQGASSPIVNGRETARYVVNGGPVSNYSFMKNTVTPVAFPVGLTNFVPGRLYSLQFDGNVLILLADRPITIAQALLILPPENINAASLANGHISLAWDKVGTETDYVIYRSDSETETYARLGTANTTSYTDATVTIGNTYYYRISSVKNNVESEKSAVVVSALAEIGSLASPEGLTVTGQTENSITLSWQAVSDATSYKVYKGSSSDAVNEYVAETASISYTVTGLAANTSYYFAVSAAHESGESLPSAAVQGKTSLASPQGLSVTGQTGNSISLSWQAVSGATSYKVYKGSSSDSISDYVAETALASYTVTDLESNTSYYFTVSAVYESEESLPSATVQGKTSLASPQGLSITGQTENSITLSWQAVSGATSYKVYKGSSSDTVNEYVVETSLASHTVTGLTAGTSYYFSVSAIHESGESLPSVAVQEKTSEMIAPVPVVIAGDLSLTVNWDSVPLADSYNVYCSTAPILPGTPYQTGVTGTSATITGLSNDTTYYVWVEAVKSGGTKTSEAVPGIPQLPTVQEHTVYSATGFTQAVAEINASSTRGFYHITLFSNITANNVSFSATSVEKTIVIKGDTSLHTISNTADTNLFSVWSGNTLVLENNVKLDGNARTGNVVQIYDEGTLVMKDGSRIENAKGYSAVSVYNGIFDMSGGEISGNAGSLCSVYVSGGVFTMSGGKVSGSTGSGVGIYGGTSTMSGGEISGNTSSGVSISTGTFMMSGGEICGNTSNGVSSSGTFTMSGGEISRNTASYSGGGGVYVSGGTFTMSGGTISDNIASSSFSSYGGGVSVISGTFTMSGGEISGNTSSYGGGVSVISYNSSYISTFTMSGGEISGNISSSGGGVYVSNYDSSYNATFTKNGGGTIYGSDASNDLKNTAESGDNYGHAVYVYGSPAKKRDITAGPSVNMNSNYTGAAGGWEE